MEKDENNLSFDMVKNHPTERRYILLKPISSSFMDSLKRVLGRD